VEAIQQVTDEFSNVVYKTIIERGISSDTAKAYKCYKNGDDFHFGYTDDKGNVVAAKHRDSQKKFSISGDWKQAQLYGQHLFGRGGKYVTVVEGEFDAMAAYQMLGSKWPVVSIRNGAASAVKDIQKQYEWLDSFDSIVICFDADEPGQRAAQQVAELFGSKAQLFKHRDGFKDASDYLQSRQEQGVF
jgi:twinkle protein